MVIGFVLQMLTNLSLYRVATKDPGYIMRQQGLFAVGPFGESPLASMPNLEGTRTDVNVNGTLMKLKFCRTCKIVRPPRTSHCGKCDMCVERFDHHCPWIGNCVGKRNYGRFFLFLCVISISSIYTSMVCLAHTLLRLRTASDETDLVVHEIPEIVLGVAALLVRTTQMALYCLGLLVYHLSLLTSNQTTYERIKAKRLSDYENPYDLGGPWDNCIYMLFPDLPYTRVELRQLAKSLDSSRIHVSPKAEYIGLSLFYGGTNAQSDAGICEGQQSQAGQSTRGGSREDQRRPHKVVPATVNQPVFAEDL